MSATCGEFRKSISTGQPVKVEGLTA